MRLSSRQIPSSEVMVQPDASADFFQQAYDALHDLAARFLRRERPDHTLQPTALVNEAYVKLEHMAREPGWNSKTHFQAVAASAMRQILVDHARQRRAKKRGGDWRRVNLTPGVLASATDVDFESLDEAMKQLADLDERKSRVVELRFFGGLTCKEIAAELGVTARVAEADWYFARAWLRQKLDDTKDGQAS